MDETKFLKKEYFLGWIYIIGLLKILGSKINECFKKFSANFYCIFSFHIYVVNLVSEIDVYILRTVVTNVLENLPLNKSIGQWCQLNGAPSHCTNKVVVQLLWGVWRSVVRTFRTMESASKITRCHLARFLFVGYNVK